MPAELTPAEALAKLRLAVEEADWLHHGDMILALKVLAAAVEDAERFDWLEKSIRTRIANNGRGQWEVSTFFLDYDHDLKTGARLEFTQNHLRAAIDAARTPAPGERT